MIGENRRAKDMNVNAVRAKKLTNIRAAGKDEATILTPPHEVEIEWALEWLEDDELLEVTPAVSAAAQARAVGKLSEALKKRRGDTVEERDQIYVGGQFVKSDAKNKIDVISPNTEEVIGRVPDATPKDVDRAVAAAREAFDKGPFPRWSPEERAAGITRLSEALKKRGQEIAKTISSENGCPIATSFGFQVFASTMVLDVFADIAKTFAFEEKRKGAMGQTVHVRRAPVGVCAAVVPWNVPLYVMAMKLGPALAAGCTVVVKAAPETALDPYGLMDAVQDAGLPPGVLNVLSAGRETSEYLVKHPGIDKVSFTGSTATGQRIGEICGSQIKRCTLELGGKSAGIVLEDVNLETAVPQMLGAGLMNNGQACAAQTRFLAPRKRYKEIVDAMAAGDARDEARRLARPGHADRPGGRQAAARQDRRLPRGRQEGRRQGRLRRRRSQGPQGLVHRADFVLRREQPDDDRARGDLRARAGGDPVRHGRAGDRDRQRLGLRPGRRRLVRRQRARRRGRPPDPQRRDHREHGDAARLPQPLRRLQEERASAASSASRVWVPTRSTSRSSCRWAPS